MKPKKRRRTRSWQNPKLAESTKSLNQVKELRKSTRCWSKIKATKKKWNSYKEARDKRPTLKDKEKSKRRKSKKSKLGS
ncbi:hypothetical protein HYE32_03875 [Mycoplasmopsis bovis]|nr:hypothetical protein [Mycoplasmopsis bovis]QQH22369.1 hypothetical protein HYE32_03875 [Mycoplasmopsis bovis]